MDTVLILGATSDMGRSIARRFAEKGHGLQLAARNTESLKPLQSDLQTRHGVACTLHAFDAIDFEGHRNFWNGLHPKPDTCIVVFGYMEDNARATEDPTVLLNTVNVNFTGAVSILNVVSRAFLDAGKGWIACIGSAAGERGRASNYVYGSAKAGLKAYLSGLRNELHGHGIHVCTVIPGFVRTRMTQDMDLPGLLTAEPEDVANTVYKSLTGNKDVVYVKWYWKWIMMIIRNIPESVFKRMRL